MEPTLEDRGVFFVNKTNWRRNRLKRGDVVIALSPLDRHTLLCKRVLHMEADKLYVDRYDQTITVPKNQVWIEGDNKDNSFDSRHHGPIDKELVHGVALFKLYPEFKWL